MSKTAGQPGEYSSDPDKRYLNELEIDLNSGKGGLVLRGAEMSLEGEEGKRLSLEIRQPAGFFIRDIKPLLQTENLVGLLENLNSYDLQENEDLENYLEQAADLKRFCPEVLEDKKFSPSVYAWLESKELLRHYYKDKPSWLLEIALNLKTLFPDKADELALLVEPNWDAITEELKQKQQNGSVTGFLYIYYLAAQFDYGEISGRFPISRDYWQNIIKNLSVKRDADALSALVYYAHAQTIRPPQEPPLLVSSQITIEAAHTIIKEYEDLSSIESTRSFISRVLPLKYLEVEDFNEAE